MKSTIRSPRSRPASSRWFFRARRPAFFTPPIRACHERWRRPGNRDFAPRIGLAYSPNSSGKGLRSKFLGGPGKTSIRASYGMFYTAIEALTMGVMSANAPYGTTYTSPAPPLFSTPFVTAASGQNLGQYFPVTLAPLNSSAKHPDQQCGLVAVRAHHRDCRTTRPPTAFRTRKNTCFRSSAALEPTRCLA